MYFVHFTDLDFTYFRSKIYYEDTYEKALDKHLALALDAIKSNFYGCELASKECIERLYKEDSMNKDTYDSLKEFDFDFDFSYKDSNQALDKIKEVSKFLDLSCMLPCSLSFMQIICNESYFSMYDATYGDTDCTIVIDSVTDDMKKYKYIYKVLEDSDEFENKLHKKKLQDDFLSEIDDFIDNFWGEFDGIIYGIECLMNSIEDDNKINQVNEVCKKYIKLLEVE